MTKINMLNYLPNYIIDRMSQNSKNGTRDSEWFMIFSYAIQLILVMWTYMHLFNKLSKFRVFIQSLSTLLFYTLFMVIFGVIKVLIAGFFAFG